MTPLPSPYTPDPESLSDRALTSACNWLASNPRRLALVLCICIASPSWIEKVLP